MLLASLVGPLTLPVPAVSRIPLGSMRIHPAFGWGGAVLIVGGYLAFMSGQAAA